MNLIKLTNQEYNYMISSVFLSQDQKNTIKSNSHLYHNMYFLNLSAKKVDQIRDLIEEQLQVVGFDFSYQLTTGGKILQSLSDKFYIG